MEQLVRYAPAALIGSCRIHVCSPAPGAGQPEG